MTVQIKEVKLWVCGHSGINRGCSLEISRKVLGASEKKEEFSVIKII